MKQFQSFTGITSIIGITAAMLFLGVSGQQQKEDPIVKDCTPTSCPAPQICVSQPALGRQSSSRQPSQCECPKASCDTVTCPSGKRCVVQTPLACPQGSQTPTPQCCPATQCVPYVHWRTSP